MVSSSLPSRESLVRKCGLLNVKPTVWPKGYDTARPAEATSLGPALLLSKRLLEKRRCLQIFLSLCRGESQLIYLVLPPCLARPSLARHMLYYLKVFL